jgi:hypothetical protein
MEKDVDAAEKLKISCPRLSNLFLEESIKLDLDKFKLQQ